MLLSHYCFLDLKILNSSRPVEIKTVKKTKIIDCAMKHIITAPEASCISNISAEAFKSIHNRVNKHEINILAHCKLVNNQKSLSHL